jgi:short-subunit dehydrogenase
MRIKLKKLRDQVIVITGASSGIGLTTAEMASEAGARVVLSSRNEADLRKAVERIRASGGRATYFVADVADDEAMEDLASYAMQEFGGIDTWVNNAGLGIYGRTMEVALSDKRRLFDVNFWGVVHGCRAAIRHLRTRGGALINIGSMVSDRAAPLLGIYSASKQAVKGYTDALRMELEEARVPVAVTLVKPASINTPFIEHAGNYMEAEPEFAPPVYAPETVARAILRCAVRPTRDITVGGGGKVMTAMGTVAPRLTDLYMESTLFEQQKKDEAAHSASSLYAPQQDGRRRGPTERMTFGRSGYTRAALSDVGRVLPFIAVGALVAAGLRNRNWERVNRTWERGTPNEDLGRRNPGHGTWNSEVRTSIPITERP